MIASLSFPSPDPIPLPAPVILFKLLHSTVLTLHFVMVQWVLGWILIGALWNWFGRSRGNPTLVEGSTKVAAMLPILMTYLINFGIPPLLFTQVLYGSFLYTSSVLIGAWWISVIFLVILVYSLLYVGNTRAATARAWWGFGLLALIVAIAIAKIYSSNMTLMLRPAVWVDMFRAHPSGTSLPPFDPTMMPRWLFMLAGSVTMGGLAFVAIGSWQKSESLKALMVRQGGWIAFVGALLQTAAGFKVYHAQPGAVLSQLAERPLYHALPPAWIALTAAVIVLGIFAALRGKAAGKWMGSLAATLGLLGTAAMVIYRDGIRDMTLLTHGYDVWSLKVVANWPIVILFLGTFVVGLLIMGWMVSVAMKAKASGGSADPYLPSTPNPKEIAR